MTLEIVLTGTWLYDGLVAKPVDIVALDYDWWYRLGELDDQLEVGEMPKPMGQNGYLYYVRFRRATETNEPTWVDSDGHQELSDAMMAAEEKVVGEIQWQG